MTEPSPRQHRPLGRTAGFTLLELLTALAITAMISVTLFACLRIAFKARSAVEIGLEPTRTADLAFDFLRADFESVLPASGTLAGPFIATDLPSAGGADADSIQMCSLGNGAADFNQLGVASEVRRVELFIDNDPDNSNQQVLIRRVTGNLLATVEPPPFDEVICRGITGMNLRYFDGTDWQDSWDSTQRDSEIPAAVEVTLEFKRDVNGRQVVTPYQRVFILSASTLSATSTSSSSTTGGAF